MMTTNRKPLGARSLSSLLAVFVAGCEDVSALETAPSAAGGAASPASAVSDDPIPQEEIVLPTPDVELPQLPWDKGELEAVQAMDAMIVDSQHLAAAVTAFEAMYHALQDATNVSMSGTSEDQIRAAIAMVDGFREFDRRAVPFGRKAEAAFKAKYENDESFGSTFRETFKRAEEELWEVIEDNQKRRKTGAAMTNGYRYASGSNVSYLERMLEESEELRTQALERVVQSVETDMVVADYKKGNDLTDLLRASRSKLEVVQALDADGNRVNGVLARVIEKEESRKEEVAAARAAYRFPERYEGPNVPSEFYRLEENIRSYMKKKGYDVRLATVASPWIKVHSPLGIHLYSQVDFYVAVPSDDEPGVIDVLYVTGKTHGPEPRSSFARMAVGTIAQMLEENL